MYSDGRAHPASADGPARRSVTATTSRGVGQRADAVHYVGVLGLQQMAGNRAVAQALAGRFEVPVQRDSTGDYLQQAWLAARRGGVVLALAAFMLKSAASQNSVDYVGYGYHLGPGDALRHCTWSALVMGAAIGDETLSRSPPVSQRTREDVIAACSGPRPRRTDGP